MSNHSFATATIQATGGMIWQTPCLNVFKVGLTKEMNLTGLAEALATTNQFISLVSMGLLVSISRHGWQHSVWHWRSTISLWRAMDEAVGARANCAADMGWGQTSNKCFKHTMLRHPQLAQRICKLTQFVKGCTSPLATPHAHCRVLKLPKTLR